jgi:CheY-like chemotaxis protein
MNTASASPARILVAERNHEAGEVLAMVFRGRGCEVRVVATGDEALACAQEFAPDAVFSSLQLSDIDGITLTQQLRALPEINNCIFVAVTGNPYAWRLAYEAGFNYYLVKPCSFEDLLAAVESLNHRMYPLGEFKLTDAFGSAR